MQEEWYHPSERDTRRFEAALSTPEGRERIARSTYELHKTIEWRIQHRGLVLSPEEMAIHKAVMEKHGHIHEP
jgi:hypothetical protein